MEENQSHKPTLEELNETLKDLMLQNLDDPNGEYINRDALGLRALKS